MDPARLASSKQAAGSKPRRARFKPRRARFKPQGHRGSEIENNVPTLSGMVFHNLPGTNFFSSVEPPPVGSGDLMVFGLVLDLEHLEKFWARAENRKKTQFPGAKGTFGGGIRPPKIFSPEVHNFSTLSVSADRNPGAGNRKILVF